MSDLALTDQSVHVAKERLELQRRPVGVDRTDGFAVRRAQRVWDPRRRRGRFAGAERSPLTIDAEFQGPLQDFEAVLGGRVHVKGRSCHAGIEPVRRLEQLAFGVSAAARDLPAHLHAGYVRVLSTSTPYPSG